MQGLRKKSRYHIIKPLDIIFFFPLLFLFLKTQEEGKKVEIFVDGKIKYIYNLNDNRTFEVEGRLGNSIIEIKEGKVRMKYSPCPDKLCMKTGYIKNRGESIICVPNRVVIRIRGDDIDGITE
uniref:NusG domain II-containing protein n=1 Tax=candidate division WOR-3 bacterium TaxID=2052148 RepID=A0A7C3YTL5_UNCW3